MTSKPRKKLIEVSIPLEAINKASAHEKMPGIGAHPRGIHIYWARRPLAACRAVLFAQLVDDPSAWPDRFPSEKAQDVERERLHKVIADMVPWAASNDEQILNAARWEIARSVAWNIGEEPPPKSDKELVLNYLQAKAPPVYDPFSGGGSIPLEAQRLGLRAFGSDLNPLAVLIGKAVVEVPAKFAGRPPVNPEAQAKLNQGGKWNGKGAQGLADDVRYYGNWMLKEADRKVGHLYPNAKLPNGHSAPVIAWLWARTVRSPDPAAKGAMVPLVSSFLLSTKEGRKSWVEPVIDPSAPDGWRFEVHSGPLSKADEERLKLGTKGGKAQAFICVRTGSTIDRSYIQQEGKEGRLSQRLMAIVADGGRNRLYLAPTADQEASALAANTNPDIDDARETFLSAPTPTRAMVTGGVCSAYGLSTWGHLFTSRQLLVLLTLSKLIEDARAEVLASATKTDINRDPTPLHEGGEGAVAYADAVATYLGLALDRCADFGNSITRWGASNEKVMNTFARQSIAMTWDFPEANFLAAVVGGFEPAVQFAAKCLETVPSARQGYIHSADAAQNNFPVKPILVSTDPPYYDNIGYADLSDFFYVWLRHSLGNVWPNLFRRLTTPKTEELVATPYWHGGVKAAEEHFMSGMKRALEAMRAAADEGTPLAIFYAFKQSEIATDGLTSAGWSSFLQAVVDSNLLVDGTWPIRSEQTERLVSKGANALASSIVLVCRKRPADAGTITRADFVRLLKRELPEAIDDIRKAGVGPVDMQQSVIGPGMGVFSRHARVLEDDDSVMSVKTALAIINRVWGEIENEADAALDAETQVALAWFASYAFDAKPSGDLITLANAKNVPQAALFASGVFSDLRGRAQLTPREQMPVDWTPQDDRTLTVWECVQHTARTLRAENGGEEAAARLIAGMSPEMRTDVRKLSDRLFQICTDKGWSQEALVYNELGTEWHRLIELAQDLAQVTTQGPSQAAFDLQGIA